MNLTRDKLPLSRWQIALRIVGTVLLTASAVMVVLGSTVLAKHLQGPRFLLYWTWCLLLTLAAIIVALADMLLVRRASKRTRRELLRQEFMSPDFTEKLRKRRDR
jgi:membrane protein implicated in regulation of membrane protease activity